MLIAGALKAISDEQIEELNEFGISAAETGTSQGNDVHIMFSVRGEYSEIFGRLRCYWTKCGQRN